MDIRRVAIVVHEHKPEARRLYEELAAILFPRGMQVTEHDPDVVLSLGGDGTMLRAAQLAHSADVPLLGFNFGTLGYLTEVEPGHEKDALHTLLEGTYTIENRMMIACEGVHGCDVSYVGLNEVLVERASRVRLVRLSVKVDGERLATFNGDGLVIATPTGSTAYAMSAGGPIVSPRAECLVVVPVAAHMMFSRPFVLAADEKVEITVEGDQGRGAEVSLDGRMNCPLPEGAAVTVERHGRPLKLVRLAGPGFVERLRSKLGLPG
ncbi:MAG: NAD(+)/NADH kinase [Actinomycetota bacterium]|nr:NAD(+)/NADH kinase [Actinomycetota bacterium]